MSIHVRPATAADAKRLAQLHAECFEQGWDVAAFEKLLSEQTNFALLAGDSEKLLMSFVLARAASGEAEILTLATVPSARCKGFARALVCAAAIEAQARNASEIFLEVAAENLPALALYRALGFAAVGKRTAYYQGLDGKSADALTLRAALPLSL